MRVDLFGTGPKVPPGIRMHQVACIPRERFEGWPRLPALRSEYEYEELSFVLGLAWEHCFQPADYDVTLSCSYPHVNWFLQRRQHRRWAGERVRHAEWRLDVPGLQARISFFSL